MIEGSVLVVDVAEDGDDIVTSDLERAAHTGQILARMLGVDHVATEPGLRERIDDEDRQECTGEAGAGNPAEWQPGAKGDRRHGAKRSASRNAERIRGGERILQETLEHDTGCGKGAAVLHSSLPGSYTCTRDWTCNSSLKPPTT